MNTKVVDLKDSKAKFEWEVTWEEFDTFIGKAYQKTKSRFRIDGFRKGKAPRHMIENYYGKGVFYEDALNMLIDENYETLVKDFEFKAVGYPSIDIKTLEEGQPVVLEFETEILPEIIIDDIENIEIPQIDEEVTDEAIDAELERQRQENTREIIKDEGAAELGDKVVIDFEGFMDGVPFEGGKDEDAELVLGSKKFIPGFEEQIVGKNIDDEFDIEVTFPEEYHAEEYAGKKAIFKTKLKGISKLELPDLDDDFASEISEFETLSELRDDIRKNFEERLNESIAVRDENAAVDALVAKTDFIVPEAMVEGALNQEVEDFKFRMQQQGIKYEDFLKYSQQTGEQVRESLKPIAEKKTRANLVLEAAAKVFGIEVTDEDREEGIKSAAEGYGMDPEKFYEMAKNHDITFMDTGLLNKKVVTHLMTLVKRVKVEEEKTEEKEDKVEEKKAKKKTSKKTTKKASEEKKTEEKDNKKNTEEE